MSFENMPFLDLFLLALVAGFFIYRLYKVLGQKTDIEKKTPWKSFKNFQALPIKEPSFLKTVEKEEEIIEPKAGEETPAFLKEKVEEIQKEDPTFTYDQARKSCLSTFITLLKAYETGNRELLKDLLEEPLWESFFSSLEERENKEHTLYMTLLKDPQIEILNLTLEEDVLVLTAQFISEQMRLLKDSKGNILEKSPHQGEEIKEVWTFTRPLKGQEWKLRSLEPTS